MEGYCFARSIALKNFLSYGSDGVNVELKPLNVLIGPNAAGKSNFLEAIALLRALPKDLSAVIREGGGAGEWLWKGGITSRQSVPAEIDVTVNYPEGIMPLRYRLVFTSVREKVDIVDEAIENERRSAAGVEDVYFFYRYQEGKPVINVRTAEEGQVGTEVGRTKRTLRREDIDPSQSVLSQRKDPDLYPEITYLHNQFSKLHLHRDWNVGRYTPPRLPQKADLPDDFLLEDASNLGLVLNDLQNRPPVKRQILSRLKRFYDAVDDITVKVHSNTVQIFLHEEGLGQPIPATRLSDGTLRYLLLVVLLCHPNPPPLICIEEPELGLHPDILKDIAELLIEASQRTQIVVTTHSDALVAALSSVPESVLVCERSAHGSRIRRLEAAPLKNWLEEYSLGDLWRMGKIGGTRW